MYLRGQYYLKTKELEEEYQNKINHMPKHRIKADGTGDTGKE